MEALSSSKMLAGFYPPHGVTSQKTAFHNHENRKSHECCYDERHIHYIHFVICCFWITGGSIWRPPPMHPYTQGMPDELVEGEEKEPRKGSLSNT